MGNNKPGWGKPSNAKRHHFFDGLRSECARWMYAGALHDVPPDGLACSTCVAHLAARAIIQKTKCIVAVGSRLIAAMESDGWTRHPTTHPEMLEMRPPSEHTSREESRLSMDEYQRRVAGDQGHTMSPRACSACGDMDGCHLPARMRDAAKRKAEQPEPL